MIQRAPSSERKTYIFDTNVLLYDPGAIFKFEEHEIVLPIAVIEELDRFKKDLNETGRNARHVSRIIDRLRASAEPDLAAGVRLEESGGTLRVDLCDKVEVKWKWADPKHLTDNLILSIALDLNQRADCEGRVIVLTKDTNLRIKADALGVRAEDYEHGKVPVEELYGGQLEITVEPALIETLYRQGEVECDTGEMVANQFVVLRNSSRTNQTALGRVGEHPGTLKMVKRVKEGVWGIFPRNKEQTFALDLLLDDDIKLVTLVGMAGTGKTLLAIAAGLHKAAEEGIYHRLVVSRPIYPLGKDIGFLPGDIEEKLNPWMKPVYDNVEFILDSRRGGWESARGYQDLIREGLLEIEPLTYIRGRSIPHQYLIVDEAQNLTPHEIKTIITRAGDGTKIVLTGDPYQIDNPYVDSTSNGLVFVVEKFRGNPIAGHITLNKGERSELAELAANLL